uniref:Golgi apparatus membrane protein TVP15 n=1 Tax=Rhizochromulina marina TaxID=1034831 RepID=A0A7S2WTI7_9STRA|mmetsp:Transcript_4146/g.12233  ORF Transcript_4146/g.12233 Transcript_4146/m.12233 type:complete len:222 (+) Transcript_4146:269-934(+)
MFGGRKVRKTSSGHTSTARQPLAVSLGVHVNEVEDMTVSDREAYRNFCFIRFCVLLNWANRLVATVAMICAMAMALISWNSAIEFIFHSYIVGFCGAVVLAEYENKRFFRIAPFLEGWMLRGTFFIFVGVLLNIGVLLKHASPGKVFSPLRLVTMACSLSLSIAGFLYLLMGLLCFRRLKQWQLQKAKQKQLIKAEREVLSKQKDEIERLLVDTEKKMELL